MLTRQRVGVVALVGVLGACTAADDGGAPPDDEAALGSYDDLFADVPAELPTEGKADAVYPPKHDALVAEQTPVRSQGRRGVCSIFATTAQVEHLYRKAGMDAPDFSEQFLQWSTKVELGRFTTSGGSNDQTNLTAVATYGTVEEAAWPYQSEPWTEANDPDCAKEEKDRPVRCHTNGEPPADALQAPRFKVPRPRYLSPSSIKARIAERGMGVSVGLDFFYQAWGHRLSTLPTSPERWRQGIVLAPNDDDVTASHEHQAGHAIYVVGWDDTMEVQKVDKDNVPLVDERGAPVMERGFYLFKNSWGTAGFGIENPEGAGYGWIAMSYVDEHGYGAVSDLPTWTPPSPPDAPPAPTPDAPPATGEHYELAPAVAIPDANPSGLVSELQVPTTGALTGATVTVAIAHPWTGDLRVVLEHAGVSVVLHDRTGGTTDDIRRTFDLPTFVGVERGGAWRLTVADHVRSDVGTLEVWSIDLR